MHQSVVLRYPTWIYYCYYRCWRCCCCSQLWCKRCTCNFEVPAKTKLKSLFLLFGFVSISEIDCYILRSHRQCVSMLVIQLFFEI